MGNALVPTEELGLTPESALSAEEPAAASIETAAPETAEAATAAETATATETTPTSPDGDAPPDDGQDFDPLAFCRWGDETYGGNHTSQFASDSEFMRSAKHAMQMVGERNEDAKQWRELQEQYRGREAELDKLMSRPDAANGRRRQTSLPDYDPTWQHQIAAGTATPEVQRKYLQHTNAVLEQMRAVLANPEEFLGQAQGGQFSELTQKVAALEERFTSSSTEQAEAAWVDRHNALLRTNEGKPTILGEHFIKAYHRLQGREMSEIDRRDTAMDIARAGHPKPNATQPVPQHAVHQPPVAPQPNEKKTVADLIEQDGMGLAEAWQKIHGTPK